MKRFVSLLLSLLLILTLIPGCVTFVSPSPNPTPPVGTPPVIIAFSSNPATIDAGGTSTLLWNVTGATSVSIDQGIGQVDVAGTKVVSPATAIVYTLSATYAIGNWANEIGTVTRSVMTPASVSSTPWVR